MSAEREDRERHILSLRPQVLWIARGVKAGLPLHVALDDLVAEGWIGAIRAVDRWDPAKGALSTIAEWSIRSAIADYLRAQDFLSRHDRAAFRASVERATALGEKPPCRVFHFDIMSMPRGAAADKGAIRAVTRIEAEIDLRRLVAGANLTPKQAAVIERRFLREERAVVISHDLGVNESRVSQIKKAALRKLRAAA